MLWSTLYVAGKSRFGTSEVEGLHEPKEKTLLAIIMLVINNNPQVYKVHVI